MSDTCANLDCSAPATSRLRYRAPDRAHVYDLCDLHTDRAHDWLADRPELAVTAFSERIPARVDQPALF